MAPTACFICAAEATSFGRGGHFAGEGRLREVLSEIVFGHLVDLAKDYAAFGLTGGKHEDRNPLSARPGTLVAHENLFRIGNREVINRVCLVDDDVNFFAGCGGPAEQENASCNKEGSGKEQQLSAFHHRFLLRR